MSAWVLDDLQDTLDIRETDSSDGADVARCVMKATQKETLTKDDKAAVKAYALKHYPTLNLTVDGQAVYAILVKIQAGTALSDAEITKAEAFQPESVIEIRKHVVISIHSSDIAGSINSDTGSTRSVITFNVGEIQVSRSASAASGTSGNKFICIADGRQPRQLPGEHVYRRQTWETYGKWKAAPIAWGVE